MNLAKPNQPIFFDLETMALPQEEIAHLTPSFKAPSTWKDPEKIAAYIEEAKRKWTQEGALSAVTGQVLAIGILDGNRFRCMGDQGESESEIINSFWYFYEDNLRSFCGFNIRSFDLPFLCRRSFKLGIAIPYRVRDGRWWSHDMVDLMDSWTFGNNFERISLDELAKFLGVGAKTGTGAAFAGLWMASKEAAKDYLLNDLKITKACWEKMTNRQRPLPPMKAINDQDNLKL